MSADGEAASSAAHCPHCGLALSGAGATAGPPAAVRCEHCRLVIGPGRALAPGAGHTDPRSRGSAAGVLANAARRVHADAADRADVVHALQATARDLGCPVERLRMLDYQDAVERDPSRPALGGVLATFESWKAARRAAADDRAAAVGP